MMNHYMTTEEDFGAGHALYHPLTPLTPVNTPHTLSTHLTPYQPTSPLP